MIIISNEQQIEREYHPGKSSGIIYNSHNTFVSFQKSKEKAKYVRNFKKMPNKDTFKIEKSQKFKKP